jgi:hypothetical protein
LIVLVDEPFRNVDEEEAAIGGVQRRLTATPGWLDGEPKRDPDIEGNIDQPCGGMVVLQDRELPKH